MTTIPSWIVVLDESLRIQRTSRAFDRAMGIREETAAGRTIGDVLSCPASLESADRGDAGGACVSCEMQSLSQRAFETGQSFRRSVTVPFHIDGQLQSVHSHIEVTPFESAAGRGTLVVIEDRGGRRAARSGTHVDRFRGMVGQHPAMRKLFEAILHVSPVSVPVLIEGESGTGKELAAVAIHRESGRTDGAFVTVNCGALSGELLRSELFGHAKGAFTGACRDRVGRIELADRGTLFLDEVGELTPEMQAQLLRVLQDGTFQRVGENRTRRSDFRLVCATHRSLANDVASGVFRADLYYRLCVFFMRIPSLRERASDVCLLAKHLVRRIAEEYGYPVQALTRSFMSTLTGYAWPGNVRELENALRHATVVAGGEALEARHLPDWVVAGGDTHRNNRRALTPERVRDALLQANGNKVQAARILGTSRSTLYRFLTRLEDE